MGSRCPIRYAATVAITIAVAGTVACGSPPPALIAEADLVPPEQLEATFKPVAGWTMGAVQSNKVTGELHMTHAETTYSKGDTALKVEVTDSGLIARAVANLTSGYSEDKGRTQARSATLGGTPAVENWDSVAKEGMVNLLVANRFVVLIEGRGLGDLGVVRDFAAKFDTSALTALGKYEAK